MSDQNQNQWNQPWPPQAQSPHAAPVSDQPQGTMYNPPQYGQGQYYPSAGYPQPQGTMYNPNQPTGYGTAQPPTQGTMYNPNQPAQGTMYNPNQPAQGTMYSAPAYGVPPEQMSGYGYAQPEADEASLGKGIAAGAVAAVIGAVVWILVSGLTGYQIGWMAVGVGFLVGISVQKFGKGSDAIFGWVGAGLSLAACVVGNMVLGTIFSPIDLLFYGLAIYEGYRFSIKQ